MTRKSQPHPAPRAPRAFTLIEVLIGIIVLGLGLLGLAAVFPAVVIQQRQASDAIEGETLIESSKAYLRSSMTMTARTVQVFDPPPPQGVPGLLRAIRQVQYVGNQRQAFGMDGEWVLPLPGGNWNNLSSPITILPNGDLSIDADYNEGANTRQATYLVPVTDRLIPSVALPQGGVTPAGAQPDPRYVWDFMIRRNVATANQPREGDTLSAAVFIRRLDNGIRRQPGQTLAQMFSDRANNRAVILPVGSSTGGDSGEPTRNGTGIYSPILFSNLSFPAPSGGVNSGRDADIMVDFPSDAFAEQRRQMVAQVDQKLVGRTGVVHVVTRVFEDPDSSPPNALTINVDPPFIRDAEGVDGVGYPIWFTAQIPVAVEVFDVTVR